MIVHYSTFRVSYSDTDQMGLTHHSNYVKYYEAARMELLRSLGIPYKSIEDAGTIMPVTDISSHYLKPAFYDDEITVKTQLVSVRGPRVMFSYQLFNTAGELINEGETTLAFAHKESRRPCHPPASFVKALNEADEYFFPEEKMLHHT